MKPEGFLGILQPDQNLKKILVNLYEKGTLSRMGIARILYPDFRNVGKTKYRSALKKADEYAGILEKNGFVRRAWYKGRDYTLQITKRGEEEALKVKRSD
jgi:hypothetical protein